MKNIFKIKRTKGFVDFSTLQSRFAFCVWIPILFTLSGLAMFSFAWLFYWIFTGKNILIKILNIN